MNQSHEAADLIGPLEPVYQQYKFLKYLHIPEIKKIKINETINTCIHSNNTSQYT